MSREAKSRLVVIERTVACMRFREHVEVIYLTFFTYPLERLDAWNLMENPTGITLRRKQRPRK